MMFFPSAAQLQRRMVAVLGAWLCSMVVSGVAPWVRAQTAAHAPHSTHIAQAMERVCSASGQANWVPSPWAVEAEAQPVHGNASEHVLSCALCLPVWGLSGASIVSVAALPPAGPWGVQATAQCVAAVAALPPVRAPPQG